MSASIVYYLKWGMTNIHNGYQRGIMAKGVHLDLYLYTTENILAWKKIEKDKLHPLML
jgi:hypothetical protein